MTNKVTLEYEDNLFRVRINGKTVESDKDIDKITEKFKQVFKDNTSKSNTESWESILKKVSRFNLEGLEINEDYKNIAYKDMKYFYASNNVFYLKADTMITLSGGYELFDFVIRVIIEGFNEYEKILIFCKEMIDNYVNYRTSDSTITVTSPGFSYGYLEYNFYNKKIKKGIAVENGTFDDFVKYVEENL